MDGVVVKGSVNFFFRYFNGCKEVVFMCVNDNIFYVSYKGTFGGVVVIKMVNLMVDMVVKNGIADCVESFYVVFYKGGIVFVDTEGRRIKVKIFDKEVIVIVGIGSEGNFNGKVESVFFF